MANRKYDQQLKETVINEVIIGHRPATQVARDHEIPESAVYSWIRAHKEKNNLAVLRLLMDQYSLGTNDLPEIGSKSMVSRVLSGERALSKNHIKALSERFNIDPDLFF